MDYQRLLDLTEKILILRGGPTSGNWGHSGRPGKRGGSGRGGGFKRIGVKPGATRGKIKRESKFTRQKRKVTADNIDSFLANRRRDLENESPLKNALKRKLKGETDDTVQMYVDVMSMDKKSFDKYAQKLGIEGADKIRDGVFNRQGEIDREIASLRWELRKKNTVQFGESRSAFDDIDELPPIGENAKETIDTIRDRFGVRVIVDEGVSSDRIHNDLSRLIRAGEFGPVKETLDQKVKAIHFKKNPRYAGHTAVADFEIDKINIWTSNYSETNAYTWVHEVGHGAEEFYGLGEVGKTFDKGKRPTMYAWGNPSENFAETFTLMVRGGNQGAAIEREMKEQYDFIKRGVRGFG